jgi:hypothetical protein
VLEQVASRVVDAVQLGVHGLDALLDCLVVFVAALAQVTDQLLPVLDVRLRPQALLELHPHQGGRVVHRPGAQLDRLAVDLHAELGQWVAGEQTAEDRREQRHVGGLDAIRRPAQVAGDRGDTEGAAARLAEPLVLDPRQERVKVGPLRRLHAR